MSEGRHVVRNPDGGLGREEARRRSRKLASWTQRQADQRAAEILKNTGGGERIAHGTDGRIRSKDTIPPARDPNPPKDKEH